MYTTAMPAAAYLELVDRAHGLGLRVVIYPLGNPSGFERGIRYNADHHVGQGNDDFLRYVLADGSVRQDPNDRVVAAFDLHQDLVTEALGPCAYHYAFGDLTRYDGIVARLREVVPPLAGFAVDAGFGEQVDDQGSGAALHRDRDLGRDAGGEGVPGQPDLADRRDGAGLRGVSEGARQACSRCPSNVPRLRWITVPVGSKSRTA